MKTYSSVSISTTPELEKDVSNIRVAEAAAALLDGIHIIESLVYPKQFSTHFIKMLLFNRIKTGSERHKIHVLDEQPIKETVSWHITGVAGNRIVNAVITSIFYTSEFNRSGTREIFINGKPNYKPEFGGPTVEDIWQESGLYKQFFGDNSATSLGINKVVANKCIPIAH